MVTHLCLGVGACAECLDCERCGRPLRVYVGSDGGTEVVPCARCREQERISES